jgi:hypothetical protein
MDNEVGWRDAELFVQEGDGAAGDVEFGAGAAGVDKANGAAMAIGQIDGGAVRDVDAEGESGHIGDKRIGAGMDARLAGGGDDVAVDLFGGGETGGVEADGPERCGVRCGEARQGGLAIGHDIDAGDAGEKSGADFVQRSQRLENGRHVAGISGF